MKPCLAKLNARLRGFNVGEVTDAADIYRSRGVEDKAANVRAIEDHLRELNRQRKEIESQVLAEWKKRDPEAAAGKIEDVGEKIGGARKDTAVSSGSRAPEKTDDERPAWLRRFSIAQVVKGTHEGRWVIADERSKDFMGQAKPVGGWDKSFATKEEAEAFVPMAAVAQKHYVRSAGEGYEIWRRVGDRKSVKVVDKTFTTRDEAMEYMARHAVQVLETNTTFGEADLPLSPNRARTGPERRSGDVSGVDFKDAFGLRGVEFGNWNNQEERQALMNDAYDGLMDLADVLGIPPKAIGLNGDLALAFGARGHGLNSNRAHYERARAVINLTKERGAGTLAHEWFHAADHYFGRQDGKASSQWETQSDGTRTLKAKGRDEDYVSHGFGYKSSVRDEVKRAYENVIQTMSKKAATYVEDTTRADEFSGRAREGLAEELDKLRAELAGKKDPKYYKRNNEPATADQLADFDVIAKKMLDGEAQALATDWRMIETAQKRIASRWTNDSLERLGAIFKEVRGRSGFDSKTQSGWIDAVRARLTTYSARLKMLAEAQAGTEKTKTVPTDFAMNAKELDQGRGESYWTTPHEMAARAFQGYVEDKIAESGGVSRFLNYAPEKAGILTPWGAKRPYPHGEERKAINKAFDALVSTLKTKDTDRGVALYRRDKETGDMDAATLRREVADVAVRSHVPITVVALASDLPGDVKADARGLYESGRVWLVAENIADRLEAERTVAHELQHAGVDVRFGNDAKARERALRDVVLKNKNIRERLAGWRLQYGKEHIDDLVKLGRSQQAAEAEMAVDAMDEAVAYFAEEGRTFNGLRQFLAAIQRGLRAMGLKSLADSLENVTDAEALAFIAEMRKATEAPQTEMTMGAQPAPAFARGGQKYARAAQPTRGTDHLPAWLKDASPALRSAASKIDTFAPEKSMKEKVDELRDHWKERLVQGLFDAYAPLKRLGPTEYVKARMVKSSDGVLEGTLLYGKPVMGDDGAIRGEIDRKGFLGAMKDLKGEHDRFFMWVAGNRAERLMGENREHLFTKDEIAAMKGLNAGKMADGSSRSQAYLTASETLKSYNRAILDIAEKSGLIDRESRHLWEHDFYVPFFRVGEDLKIDGPGTKVKGLVRQQAFKKLKGGEEPLGDLMANTLRNWSHLLSASLANQAAVASLKAAERLHVAQVVPQDTKGATYAMVEGKKVHYSVSDPFILSAISAMESASFKGLPMEVMGKFKHYLTLGVTASPTFRIRNLMRDSIAAIGQNDVSYNVMKNVARGFKGTERGSEQYAQMLFNGALMRFGQLTDGKHAEHVKRLIADGVDDSTILTNPEKVKAALGKMWDSYQEFGDRMENVNRAALYEKLKTEGKSDLEAAFAARDMMDFSLQGSWTAVRFLTQIVPFMNARLQGLYKLGRAARQDPARLGYVTGAIALASIALLLAYKDDDEWKKREDWDRDNFWWFRIGNTAYRIPKPFEMGAIGTLAERSVELAISDEMTGKRFTQRMKSMLGDTLSLNPVPQLFKPMLDLYSNVDSFSGRQIETRGMENLSKSERSTPFTSLVAKILGKASGSVAKVWEGEGLSPVQTDHLIRSYFGWLGAHAAMTVDMLSQPFMEASKPANKLDDYLIIGDFAKQLPASQSRYVEQFYKQAKEVHEVMGDLKQAREAHDLERVQEILRERRSEVGMAHLYNAAERRMGEISRQIRLVRAGDLSPDEKRARLDALEERRAELARMIDERATRSREAAAAAGG